MTIKNAVSFLFFLLLLPMESVAQGEVWNNKYSHPYLDLNAAVHFYSKTYYDSVPKNKSPQLKIILLDDSNFVSPADGIHYQIYIERKSYLFKDGNCVPSDSILHRCVPVISSISSIGAIEWIFEGVYDHDKLIVVRNRKDTMRVSVVPQYIYYQIYNSGMPSSVFLRVPWLIEFEKGKNYYEPWINRGVSPDMDKLLQPVYFDTNQIISAGAYVSEYYASLDSIHCALTTKNSYTLNDTMEVLITGTIRLSGSCEAIPSWGLESFQNGKWITLCEASFMQLDCGLGNWEGRNTPFYIPGLFEYFTQKKLPDGEYRLIFLGENLRPSVTNSFFVSRK